MSAQKLRKEYFKPKGSFRNSIGRNILAEIVGSLLKEMEIQV